MIRKRGERDVIMTEIVKVCSCVCEGGKVCVNMQCCVHVKESLG